MRSKYAIGFVLALGAPMLLGACNDAGTGGGGTPGTETDPTTLKGKPAEDFTLKTLDGKSLKLSDEKGKVVLMDTWATWCPPCRASLPHLQKSATDPGLAGKGLVVWAINDAESADDVRKFLADNKYTFTVLMDTDAAVIKKYLISGIPTTFVIGRDGIIENVFVGYSDASAGEIDAAVDKALAEKAPR